MVAVFIPGWNATPSAWVPDHQFHAALPALIQDGSSTTDGGFRLSTIFDSTRRPGSSPSISTRQGDCNGVAPMIATFGLSGRGTRTDSRANGPGATRRYMPA